jgi:LmbE family N-acetylglucosaminyl deacetylase
MIDEINKGSIIHMRFGTVGGKHRLQNYDTRMDEVASVMNSLGIEDWKVYYKNKDAEMDTIPQRELATMMDKDIDEIRPDELFCCYPSVHQDHIAMYNAFMITQRLRDGFIPGLVALGEYPFILTSKQVPEGGFWYHPMSEETLRRKIELFEMYKTQLRPAPSPLGSRGVEVLATTRGLECGHRYAEKFYLQKLIR